MSMCCDKTIRSAMPCLHLTILFNFLCSQVPMQRGNADAKGENKCMPEKKSCYCCAC